MKGLENVKAGDDVIYRGGYSGDSILRADRVTATQIVCGSRRFSKGTGRLIGYVGSSYSAPRITFAEGEALETARLAARVRDAQYSLANLKLSAATIDAAEQLIKAAKEPA